MKPTSRPSGTRHTRLLLTALLPVIFAAPMAFAAVDGAIHDPHRLPDNTEFQKTIEARCTICHSRGQVDTAIAAQQDLDALLQRMIERGAILSKKDRNVLGTFWGSPGKSGQ